MQGDFWWTEIPASPLIAEVLNPVTDTVRGKQRRKEPGYVLQDGSSKQLKMKRHPNRITGVNGVHERIIMLRQTDRQTKIEVGDLLL